VCQNEWPWLICLGLVLVGVVLFKKCHLQAYLLFPSSVIFTVQNLPKQRLPKKENEGLATLRLSATLPAIALAMAGKQMTNLTLLRPKGLWRVNK